MNKTALKLKTGSVQACMIPVVLTVILSVFPVVAGLEEKNDDDKTLSPYFYVQTEDDNDQLPLKSTAADVTVSGVIADVEVTQVYKNEGKNTLEAIYIFPGSTHAAVYAMRMTIGERTIEAKVEEKAAARKTYEKALSEGKTASLLEQQRPNVFQMNVGNILPGDEITVKLNYTELLVPENSVYEFVYPAVVGPRYSNKTAAEASANEKWVANPYIAEGKETPFTFAFSCRINSGIPIKKITSPSHKIGIGYTGKTTAQITLDTSTATGNRDVVLRYVLAGDKVESGLLMNIGKEEDFFLLMVEPPQRVSPQQIAPREYIFIMDVSGSMNGFPMDVAKSLMEQLLSGLRSNDYFNVLLFAGSNKLFSDQSVPYNSANLKRALAMMKRERGAGGTELMPALRQGLSLPPVGESVARSIVVITDGFVSADVDALDFIRTNLNNGNVFAFGIGSSVNRYLIEGMARAGMGEPFVALNKDDALVKAKAFKEYIEAPVLTDIAVKFKGMNVSEVEPPTIPDLFAERPIVLFGKYHGTPKGTLTVTGKNGKKKYNHDIRVSEGKVSTKNGALRYLWARHQIRRLTDMAKLIKNKDVIRKITKLGIDYNLLTDYTSFVAVDTEKRTDGKPDTTVKQPLPLPEGVSNNAVGTLAMQRPVPARNRMGLHRETIQLCRKSMKDDKLDEELEKLKKQLEKEAEKTKDKEQKQESEPERKFLAEAEVIERQKLQVQQAGENEERIDEELRQVKGISEKEAPKSKREVLMEKIRQLEEKKQVLRSKVKKKSESMQAPRKGLPEVVARYEKLLANCTVRKSERCADVLYTLGTLYYDKARDDYIRKRDDYENAMKQWERSREGTEPQNPVPDYSQSSATYKRLIDEYPKFKKLSEVYYQMGTIYLLMGDVDKAKEAFATIIRKYPKSPRASGGHYHLSDLCYLDRDNSCAIKHLEKVREDGVDVQTWETVHYRKAEVYYNMGEYKKAQNLFYTYIEKCDAGLYPKREFRDVAPEFMAIAFSKMEDGVKEAETFFEKAGSKTYEPDIFYEIGIKYRSKEKCGMAIKAFELVLQRFPMYKHARFVSEMLAECYKKQGNNEMAAKVRKRMAADYGPGSKWYDKNAGAVEAVEKVRDVPARESEDDSGE